MKNTVGYLYHNHFLPHPLLSSLLTEHFFVQVSRGYMLMESAPLPNPREKMLNLSHQRQFQFLLLAACLVPVCNAALAKRHNRMPDGNFSGEVFLPAMPQARCTQWSLEPEQLPRDCDLENQRTKPTHWVQWSEKIESHWVPEEFIQPNLQPPYIAFLVLEIIFPSCLNQFNWAFSHWQLKAIYPTQKASLFI